MKEIRKTDKSTVITIIGMAVMIAAVAVKAAMSSVIAAAVIHAAAHYAAGAAGIVAWDLGSIFVDAILFALLYRKTGNCLISFVPHFLNNMIGFFLVPLIFA